MNSKKCIIITFLITALMFTFIAPGFAVFTPPDQTNITDSEKQYASQKWTGVKWDATRAKKYQQIV